MCNRAKHYTGIARRSRLSSRDLKLKVERIKQLYKQKVNTYVNKDNRTSRRISFGTDASLVYTKRYIVRICNALFILFKRLLFSSFFFLNAPLVGYHPFAPYLRFNSC